MMKRFSFWLIPLLLAVMAVTSCSDDDGRDIFQGARFLTDGDTVYLWKGEPVQVSALFGMGTDPFLAGTEWTTGDNAVFSVSQPARTMRGDSCIAYATLESRTQEGCAQLKVKFTSQYGQYKGHMRTLTLNVVNLDMEKIHLEGLPQGAFAERIGKLLFYMMPVDAHLHYDMGARYGIEIDTTNWNTNPDYYKRLKEMYKKWRYSIENIWLDDYYIGQTEVTAELWEAVMGYNPSAQHNKKRPVVNITYYECQEFCRKLSQMTGRPYRLPTEAEWEFAATGGKLTHNYYYAGSNIESEVLKYLSVNPHSGGLSAYDVKQFKPNELGLYDMSGNAAEITSDTIGGDSTSQNQTAVRFRTGNPTRLHLKWQPLGYKTASGNEAVQLMVYGYLSVSTTETLSPKSTLSLGGLRLAMSATDLRNGR